MIEINKIDFSEIGKNTDRRTAEVPKLRETLWNYVTVSNDLNVVIPEESRADALAIVAKIQQIPMKNTRDFELVNKCRDLAELHGLPINRNGHHDENPEVFDLARIEKEATNKQFNLQQRLKTAIARNLETPDEQKRLYGCHQPKIPVEDIEAGLAECARQIEAVKLIREELQPFFEER